VTTTHDIKQLLAADAPKVKEFTPMPLNDDTKQQVKDTITILGPIHSAVKDRPFYLLTSRKSAPRADGDESQQFILSNLDLEGICKQHPDWVLVDVGALHGDWGLSVATAGCKVFMVEPQRYNAKLIETSVIFNGHSPSRVRVVNAAVSMSTDPLRFAAGNHDGNVHQVVDGTNEAVLFSIPTVRIDEELSYLFGTNNKLFVIKIDVEGYDVGVLKTLNKLLEGGHVIHVIIEYTPWWNGPGQGNWRELITRIRQLGAANMYYCSRDSPRIYRVTPEQDVRFHDHLLRAHLQTDIYFVFGAENDVVLSKSGTWVEGTM